MDASSVAHMYRSDLVRQSQPQLEYARMVELSYPGVKAGCDLTFEELWKLFLDSGFLYPEKVSRLQPVIGELQSTVKTGDRIVDNVKVRAYLDPLFRMPTNRIMEMEAGHAVQFERPGELASALLAFIAESASTEAGVAVRMV